MKAKAFMPAGSGNSKSSPRTREAKTKILVWFALIVAGIAIAATLKWIVCSPSKATKNALKVQQNKLSPKRLRPSL